MIKLLKIRQAENVNVICDIIADTKTEVTDNASVTGLSESAVIALGSTVLTADGHFAIRNSSGEWKWQGDDEDSTRSVQSSVSPQLNISRGLTKSIDAVDIEDEDDPFVEELRDDA